MPLRAAVNSSGRPECSLSGTLPLPLFDQQMDDATVPTGSRRTGSLPLQTRHHDNQLHFQKFWVRKGRFEAIFLFF